MCPRPLRWARRESGTGMLLVDQVELLRRNLIQLRDRQVVLPLMGGLSATTQTYQFKALIHPARDIAATIVRADPQSDRLPARLRGWNLDITDEFGNVQRIHLKKLLGMVIHVYYLRLGDGDLDISNDDGKRVIVPYDNFLASLARLVLSPEDICLVICGLTEEKLKKENAVQALAAMTPGTGDLAHCLATIHRWPKLQESVWSRYFADRATGVEEGCQTVNDSPFVMGAHHTGPTVSWRVGWRRNDAYAVSWIDLSWLIGRMQDFFGVDEQLDHRP